MINQWLKSLTISNKKLPSFFDFGFFFEGVKKMLEQDHVYSLGKCVLMIYIVKSKMPQWQKVLLKIFFKLKKSKNFNEKNFYRNLLALWCTDSFFNFPRGFFFFYCAKIS